MSVILLNKDKFKTLLKEAPISGDKAALDIAKAQGGLERAKERLARLQITDIPGLDTINTIDQLSIEPFKFNFLLQVKDDPQGLSLPVPHPFDTLSRVIDKSPLTLEVKTDEGLLFKMIFPKEEELITQLPGTKEPIIGKNNKVMALVSEGDGKKGKFYTIEFDNAKEVVEQAKEETKEQEEIEGENENEGEEGESEKNKEQGGRVNKEQLFNDLAGFFKFTYNNRRMAAPNLFPKEKTTLESYINQIAKNTILIKEEDVNDPTKVENSIGKIYIESIILGPKARTRAGEERESYKQKVGQSQQGQSKWDGNLNNLPKGKGGQIPSSVNVDRLVIDLIDKSLTAEQQTIFNQIKGVLGKSNFDGETTIRRSAKSPKDTIIITFPTLAGKKAIICKILNNETNLRKYIDVEIAPKIAGKDDFTKSTKAKIQVR
jgi:hypothetical protein